MFHLCEEKTEAESEIISYFYSLSESHEISSKRKTGIDVRIVYSIGTFNTALGASLVHWLIHPEIWEIACMNGKTGCFKALISQRRLPKPFMMCIWAPSWNGEPILKVGAILAWLQQQLHENPWYVTVTSHATTLILYLQCSIQCSIPEEHHHPSWTEYDFDAAVCDAEAGQDE